MLGPVTCRACGAKVREDRARCLRCGEPLAGAEVAAGSAPARTHARTLLLPAAGVVIVAAAVMFVSGRPAVPDPSAPVVAAAAATAPAPSGVDIESAGPEAAAVSIDIARQGLVAYTRGDIAGSIEQFRAAVDADPNNAEALNNLGQGLVRDGRARDAIPYFDRAIGQTATVWAYHFNRARAYAVLKEWTPAIAGYREAAQLFPDDYVTAFNLARALQESGNLPAAIVEYERAIALAPGEADFHLSHGYALEQAQRPQEAADAYRRYLQLQEAAPQAEKIKARIAQLGGTPPAAAAGAVESPR